jgi:hypothetical protein
MSFKSAFPASEALPAGKASRLKRRALIQVLTRGKRSSILLLDAALRLAILWDLLSRNQDTEHCVSVRFPLSRDYD